MSPYKPVLRDYLKTGEAAKILECSPTTALVWAERYGLGRRVAGQMRFDPEKTKTFAQSGQCKDGVV